MRSKDKSAGNPADTQGDPSEFPAENEDDALIKSLNTSFANDSGIVLGHREGFYYFESDSILLSNDEHKGVEPITDDQDSLLDDIDSESDSEISLENEPLTPQSDPKESSCRSCSETFSIVKLARLVLRRATDCVEGIWSCVLWIFDCTKWRPDNLKRKSSGCSQALINGVSRILRLMMDRKVFVSVLIYGAIAFLENVVSEVRSESFLSVH